MTLTHKTPPHNEVIEVAAPQHQGTYRNVRIPIIFTVPEILIFSFLLDN